MVLGVLPSGEIGEVTSPSKVLILTPSGHVGEAAWGTDRALGLLADGWIGEIRLPLLRSTTTASGPVGSTSFTIDKPAGTASGDYLLIAISHNNTGGTVGTPAGFTKLAEIVCTADTQVICIFGRLADGTEGTTFTGTLSASAYNDWAAVARAYTGVDSITPVDVTGASLVNNTLTASPATLTMSGVTTDADNCLLVVVAGVDVASSSTPVASYTTPAGFGDPVTIVSARPTSSIFMADMLQAAAGASGSVSTTATYSGNAGRLGVLLALSPPVDHPLRLTGILPGGTVGVAYSATLTLGGVYTAPVTIDTSVGSLPPWMSASVNGNTVTFSGTPTATETDSFTVRATSTDGQVATSAQSVTIAAASGTYATLDGTSVYGVELSNGNLSLRTYDGGGARTLESAGCVEASTANRYWEASIDIVAADNYGTIGLASPGNTSAPGWTYEATPTSAGVNNQGHLYVSQSAVSAFFTYVAGDVLKFCLKNGNLWIGKVGSGWYGGGDPDAGTGAMLTGISGLRGPSAGSISSLEHKVTFNFGATPWADTPPTGAAGWTK